MQMPHVSRSQVFIPLERCVCVFVTQLDSFLSPHHMTLWKSSQFLLITADKYKRTKGGDQQGSTFYYPISERSFWLTGYYKTSTSRTLNLKVPGSDIFPKKQTTDSSPPWLTMEKNSVVKPSSFRHSLSSGQTHSNGWKKLLHLSRELNNLNTASQSKMITSV